MNTEIPNNTPVTDTPVNPVVPPVAENPVPTEVPSDTLTAPVVEESAPNLGFDAPPVNAPGEPTSITPVEPVAPAMPETAPAPVADSMTVELPQAPVETVPAVEPVAPVVTEAVPMAPVEPVAPAMPEVAPAVEPVAPVESVAPAMPEMAPVETVPAVEPVTPVVTEAVPMAPVEPEAPAMPEATPAVPEEPFVATSVAPEAPVGGTAVEPMPGSTNPIPDQNIAPAPTTEAKPKKGKGGLVAIIIVIVLLLLVVGGWFVYIKVLLTPEKVYETTVRKLFDAAESTKENNKFVGIVLDPEKPFTLSGNISLDSDIEELEILKNYSLDFKLGADYKNNKLLAGASLNENGKVVASPEVYFADNKLYLSFKEVYDSIFELGEYEIDLSEYVQNSDNGDVQVVVDGIEEALIQAIKSGELTKASTKFNGKSVTDNTYTVNDSNYGTVVKAALNYLKSNDAVMQSLANLSESEKADVVAYFDELINTDMTAEIGIDIKFHLYTGGLLGNQLYGFEFEFSGQKLVTYTQDDEDYSLKVIIDETTTIEAVKKGTVTTVTYLDTSDEENKLVVTITETNDNLNISFTIETYKFTLDLTTKEADGGVNEVIKVSITETSANETISLILDLTAKEGTIEIPALEKAVNYEALTTEERQKINQNLSNVMANSEIYALYETYVSSLFETDTEDEDIATFGTLESSLYDYEWAAFNAYDMSTMTADSICFSNKYLVSKGYLDEDYADYTGSVMIKKGTGAETDTYYIWVSDGESSYKKADYWASNYTVSTDTSVSNNCDGLAKYNCTDDGKCS